MKTYDYRGYEITVEETDVSLWRFSMMLARFQTVQQAKEYINDLCDKRANQEHYAGDRGSRHYDLFSQP
jgi:hypothetical protein